MKIQAVLTAAMLTPSGTGDESTRVRKVLHTPSGYHYEIRFTDEDNNLITVKMDPHTYGLLTIKMSKCGNSDTF